jgi:hypothetical protein
MSLFAIATFDLHVASTAQYPRLKRALAGLQLRASVTGKNLRRTRLPHNTFVAKFAGKSGQARRIRNRLTQRIEAAMQRLGLKATVFIAVSGASAWQKKRI